MLYLIMGKNSYVAEQELAKITQHAPVPAEHVDTQQLDAAGLAELVRGVSLFAAQRLIVLRRLSERPDLWEQLGQWAHDIPDETTLVLVEPGLDKRTKTYKALHKAATIIAADPLTDRQRPAAERWLRQLANARGVSLSPAHVRSMVERALVPDEKGYGGRSTSCSWHTPSTRWLSSKPLPMMQLPPCCHQPVSSQSLML